MQSYLVCDLEKIYKEKKKLFLAVKIAIEVLLCSSSLVQKKHL